MRYPIGMQVTANSSDPTPEIDWYEQISMPAVNLFNLG
jgi:hypothetical protein